MHLACPLCGADLGNLPAADHPDRSERTCPTCGARLALRRVDRPEAESDAGTVFQPRILVESAEPVGTETLATPPARDHASGAHTPAASDLPPGPEAYFLVVGAPAGRERIRLERARTVFGRAGSDVELSDPAVADRQFQIEVAGSEFYLRDLESGRETRLNGKPVRYTELLPGDEIVVGTTALVFRTADDGLSRRGR